MAENDNAAENVPKWAASVPCCLYGLLKFFYLDLLVPDDTFEAAVRKILIAVGPWILVTSPVPQAVGLLLTTGLDTISGIVAIALIFLWGPLYLGLFGYARCNPARAGDGILTDIWTAATAVLLFVTTLASPTTAIHIPQAMTMYLAVTCRAPRRLPTCIVAGVAAMVSIYDRAAFATPPDPQLPLIAIPDATERLGSTMRADLILFTLNIPVIACLELVLRESDRRQTAARASVALAKELAAALSRYDTKAAAETLKVADAEAAEGNDGADPELVAGFASIVANLDEYRPHLPNWLVDKHARGTTTDEDAGSESETLATVGGHEDAPELNGALDAALERSGRSLERSGRTASTVSRGSIASRSKGRSRATSHAECPAPSPSPKRDSTAAGPIDGPPLALTRTIAVAALDVDASAISEYHPRDRAAALHAFVDRVYSVARETKAAVHSFVGDAIVATWNAASACHQPEAKAARFAARLRAHATDTPYDGDGVRVTGGVVTGTAAVLMAGLGDQRALLASLTPKCARLLKSARDAAADRDAVLVPASLAKAAHYAAHFRLAAVVAQQQNHAADSVLQVTIQPTPDLLYAVVGEVTDGGDEWMYVLEQQQGQSGRGDAGAAEAAAQACERGDFATALQLLNAACEARSGERSRMAERLSQLRADVSTVVGV